MTARSKHRFFLYTASVVESVVTTVIGEDRRSLLPSVSIASRRHRRGESPRPRQQHARPRALQCVTTCLPDNLLRAVPNLIVVRKVGVAEGTADIRRGPGACTPTAEEYGWSTVENGETRQVLAWRTKQKFLALQELCL